MTSIRTNSISLTREMWEKLDQIAASLRMTNRQDAIAYLIMNYEVH